jgi:imidazolonepropionase-like amidohydrolase
MQLTTIQRALLATSLFAFATGGAARASMQQDGDDVSASPVQDQGGEGSSDSAKKSDEKDKDKDKEKEEERWFAVTNGDIYTGVGEHLRGATLLARNGKIKSIGYDVDLPPDTKVLDANGLRVYPGLVAIASQGLLGNSGSELEDTIDPFNSRMTLGLATGITTTGIGNTAVKLKRFALKNVVVRDRIFATFSWTDRNPGGKRSLREKFVATSDYLRQYRDWEEKVKKDKELKEPAKKSVDTSVLAVLRGEMLAKFNANERDDLLGIAHLAQEFGFRPVIEGCQEGWTVADELGRAGAMAIITPRDRRAKDELLVREGGTSIENAAILHRAGVPVAVVPATQGVDLGGIVGRDIMALPLEADFAVRGGLPEDAALASITSVPARILGINHRVGTLQVGKDCDLIVTDGDVLHYETFVQYAVVDGRQVYDKEKELFFAHIRPRESTQAAAKKVEPAPKKLDKGETEPKPGEAKPKDDEKNGDDKSDKKDDEKKGGGEKGDKSSAPKPDDADRGHERDTATSSEHSALGADTRDASSGPRQPLAEKHDRDESHIASGDDEARDGATSDRENAGATQPS